MLSGRTCLITGATRGIGLATAKELARLHARVIMVGRDEAAMTRATREISSEVPSANVDSFLADLSLQREIRRLSAELHERYSELHLLVHNAAIVTAQRVTTDEMIETQFAVNHLAPFLLTNLLLDLLKADAPSRIVVVASQVERGGKINFDDLMGAKIYAPLEAYSQSKLANVLFTYALAPRLAGSGVTVNCLHPGVVRSNLLDTIGKIERDEEQPGNSLTDVAIEGARAIKAGIRRLLPIPRPKDWALTPEEGAKTTVYVATDPALSGISGRYFRECRQADTLPQSHDAALAQRLWDVSETLTQIGHQ